jgi:hypothetical protein
MKNLGALRDGSKNASARNGGGDSGGGLRERAKQTSPGGQALHETVGVTLPKGAQGVVEDAEEQGPEVNQRWRSGFSEAGRKGSITRSEN